MFLPAAPFFEPSSFFGTPVAITIIIHVKKTAIWTNFIREKTGERRHIISSIQKVMRFGNKYFLLGGRDSMDHRNDYRYYKTGKLSQSRNWIMIGALALGVLLLGSVEAGAVSGYYSQFQSAYTSSSLSSLSGNARCQICHPNYPSSTARNNFGSNFASNSTRSTRH